MNRRHMIGSLTLLGLAAAGSAVAALSGPGAPVASAEGCCPACPCPCCDSACDTGAQVDQTIAAPANASATCNPC